MKISENKYVTLTYDLNVGDGDERELMEQATVEQPLEFIFGTNSMLEAFERGIEGLSEGDSFSFKLSLKRHMETMTMLKWLSCPKTSSR